MDGHGFDDLTRVLAGSSTRRAFARILAGGAASGLLTVLGGAGAAGKEKPDKPKKDKPKKNGRCKDDADCPPEQYCVSREVGCFPRCPLACQEFDSATGGCVDTCPNDEYCDRLGGTGNGEGGCLAKCPQPCAPYDPATGDCEDTCGSCMVCRQGICQNGCTEPCQTCDAATGQCRGCTGPCEVCDTNPSAPTFNQCVGCDPACEACEGGQCRTTCPGSVTCCLGECIGYCGFCDTTTGTGRYFCPQPFEDLACCGDDCTDVTNDQDNCGACGVNCSGEAGEQCCTGRCINVASDPANCGACGQECLSGDADCCNGTCYSACASGESRDPATCECNCPADATECDDACVDTTSDPGNCGACGVVCRPDQICEGGTCVCAVGTDCAGACIDTTSDPANCGACGNICPVGSRCMGAQCEAETCGTCGVCQPRFYTVCGYENGKQLGCCDGTCVTFGEGDNCGTCGDNCESRGGVCYFKFEGSFPTDYDCCQSWNGYQVCGNVCRDVTRDKNNCGSCDNVCIFGQRCIEGQCIR